MCPRRNFHICKTAHTAHLTYLLRERCKKMVPGKLGPGRLGPGKLGPSPIWRQIGPRTFWGPICHFLANWAPANWDPANRAPADWAPATWAPADWAPKKLGCGRLGPSKLGPGRLGPEKNLLRQTVQQFHVSILLFPCTFVKIKRKLKTARKEINTTFTKYT